MEMSDTYCLLYRKLSSNNVPTYVFKNMRAIFSNDTIELSLQEALILVDTGRVFNARVIKNIIRAYNKTEWTKNHPYTIKQADLGSLQTDSHVVMAKPTGMPLHFVLMDLRGGVTIVTEPMLRKMIKKNVFTCLNVYITQQGKIADERLIPVV